MGKADDTLAEYFRVLNDASSGTGVYHDVDHLMKRVFCPDNTSKKIPSVGITDHGPQFIGAPHVKTLFTQLFTTFPNLSLDPEPNAPYLYSPSNYPTLTIAIQTTLRGTHDKEWFPKGDPHYSPPLSDIHPDRLHLMSIPACAVFSFDANAKVTHLAIYLDRYRMMRQLKPAD
jgi:hypothetical protein